MLVCSNGKPAVNKGENSRESQSTHDRYNQRAEDKERKMKSHSDLLADGEEPVSNA